MSAAGNSQTRTGEKKFVRPSTSIPVAARDYINSVTSTTGAPRRKQCFRCHSNDHLVSQCPVRAPASWQNGPQVRAQYSGPVDRAVSRALPPAKVTRVVTERPADLESTMSVGNVPGDKAVRAIETVTAEVSRCAVNCDENQSKDCTAMYVKDELYTTDTSFPSRALAQLT